MRAGANFLLLFVEHLLRHFLPGEAKVANHRHEAETDATARREQHRAGVAVVLLATEIIFDRAMREIAGGDDVGNRAPGEFTDAPALGQMEFNKSPMRTAELC